MKAWPCITAILAAAPLALASVPTYAANIAETAAATGQFKRFLAAAKIAGLDDALAGPGPYTVFAPTDAAFNSVRYETYRALLQPKNRAILAQVLRYHIVPGKFTARDFAGGQTFATTAQGQTVFVDGVSDGALFVNERGTSDYNVRTMGNAIAGVGGANATEIRADNGVIIPVDRVLLPN